jgi:hypothetical protein
MRPRCIVVDPPCFDHDACLGERVEYLAIQKFVAQLRTEALAVTVLPWTAGLDESRFRTDGIDPVPDGFRDKFRAMTQSE